MGRNAKTAMAAAVALALCVALAACGTGAGGPRSSYTLTIGDMVPLRGDLAAYGPPARKAADLAIQQARAALKQDGLSDRIKLDIKHEDSETQSQAGELVARKLVRDEGANCIAGDWAANSTVIAAGEAAKDDVPVISPASTNFEIRNIDDRGYAFRTAPPDQLQMIALADLVAQSLGGAKGKTVSLGARRDVYGVSFAQGFSNAWRKLGGSLATPVYYDPTKVNYTSDAQKIVAGHPDAFVIIDFPDDYQKIVPFLLKTGSFDPAKTFTSDTMLVNNSVYQGIPAKAVEGVRGTQPATPTKGTAAQAFDRLYRGAAEAPAKRQLFDAQNFDAVMLCFLASTAARTNNGQAIRDHLTAVSGPPGVKYTYLQLPEAVKALRAGKEIDYEGVSGPINFDDHGDPTVAPYRVFEYRGGKPHTLREFFAHP